MKNHLLLVAIMPILICACSSFDDKNAIDLNSSTPDLYASFADEETTKTYVENNKYLRWHEDDRLTAFYGNTLNRQYKFNGKTGDNSGTFSLVPSGELGTGNAFDRIYAVYPYNETATITDEGVISLTLPATQSYAENSFGHNANTMIAVTENLEDTFLAFKNACGYLKLHLYAPEGGTIKSIEIKGNNNEKIAGNATATIAFGEAPVITMADDATTSILLDCGEGVTLGTTAETATEFWVVIPETTFTSGITITVTDSFDAAFTKSTSNEVVIERNIIQPMAVLEFDGIKQQPYNEIWYTTSNSKIIELNLTDEYDGEFFFGANVVSNEYKDGKGVITFDGNIVKIAGYPNLTYQGPFIDRTQLTSIAIPNSVSTIYGCFKGCTALMSVTIPKSVTSIGQMTFDGCTSLTSVTIGNSVTKIETSAFLRCTALTSITIPDSVTSIGGSAFNGCSSLTSVTIPDSVTSIGGSAFYGCTSLTSITIPNSVTSIGSSAFSKSGLISVEIPYGSVSTISQKAFSECASLVDVKISNGVTTIEDSAFKNCSQLLSISLPESIQTIYNAAFSGNPNMKTIFCKATEPPKVAQVCFSVNSDMKIYVPRVSYSTYSKLRGGNSYEPVTGNWYALTQYMEPYDFD